MAQKTIWCLNMATEIVGPHQNDVLNEFGADNIKFGSRPQSKTANNDPLYKTNNLMPDEEYFVPIAPKCIGNDFSTADPYLQRIQQYYKGKGQNDYHYFWSDDCKNDRGYQMITENLQGYYSMLEATAPNILIGYSQGGLVARYLEWLDKTVYKKGLIAGVITVSSPNFGSPVANSDNKKYVLKGLIKIAIVFITGVTEDLILIGLADLVYGLLSLGGDPLTEIVDIMQKLIKDLQKEEEDFKKLINMLQSAINWLGGLRDDPNDAFSDLAITREDDPYSVLASINSMDSQITYGILSTNNKVEDILDPKAVDVIQQSLQDALNAKAEKNSDYRKVSEHIPGAGVELSQTDYDKLGKIYKNEIMVEHLAKKPVNPIINQIIGYYKNGIPELAIAAQAHDFIIPSAYQLTFENKAIKTDRNQPNIEANHLTGSSLEYDAGEENYTYVMNKLREIMR